MPKKSSTPKQPTPAPTPKISKKNLHKKPSKQNPKKKNKNKQQQYEQINEPIRTRSSKAKKAVKEESSDGDDVVDDDYSEREEEGEFEGNQEEEEYELEPVDRKKVEKGVGKGRGRGRPKSKPPTSTPNPKTKQPPQHPPTPQKPLPQPSPSRKKLLPGRKQCRKCKTVMPIHRKVCTNCGNIHQMRKRKQDIMRNLYSKVTPILIKSVIEGDGFNRWRGWGGAINGVKVGDCLRYNRVDDDADEEQEHKIYQHSHALKFQPTNLPKFQYLRVENPVTSIVSSSTHIAFIQQLTKIPTNLTQSEQLTINAYGLQNFCLVGGGHAYSGESVLYFGRTSNDDLEEGRHSNRENQDQGDIVFERIYIKRFVSKMGIWSNLVVLLTGQGTLLVFTLPVTKKQKKTTNMMKLNKNKSKSKKTKGKKVINEQQQQQQRQQNEQHNHTNQYILQDYLQIIQPKPNKITSFQLLRSTAKYSPHFEIKLLVGTLYGSISIYQLTHNSYNIVRYIPGAHWEMVTALAQCSINVSQVGGGGRGLGGFEQRNMMEEQDQGLGNYNNSNNKAKNTSSASQEPPVLFASGCYDGTIQIWDLYQSSPIFQYQCSNKKIWNIHWDPGCKYLFVNRDQLIDPCIIICFYSINKIQDKIHLSDNIQTRNITLNLPNSPTHPSTQPSKIKSRINKIITAYSYDCRTLPVLDSVEGVLRILQFEDLRSNSLKKKKPRREDCVDRMWRIGGVVRDGGGYGGYGGEVGCQLGDRVKSKSKSKSKQKQKSKSNINIYPDQKYTSKLATYPIFIQQLLQGQQNIPVEKQNQNKNKKGDIPSVKAKKRKIESEQQDQYSQQQKKPNPKKIPNPTPSRHPCQPPQAPAPPLTHQHGPENSPKSPPTKKFPIFSQMTIHKTNGTEYLYIATYGGAVIRYVNSSDGALHQQVGDGEGVGLNGENGD